MKKIMKNQIFWPLVALLVLLTYNAFFAKNFFKISVVDGHLYGNLIDILKNFSPLALLSIGMTLVIATSGAHLGRISCCYLWAIACSIIDGRLGIFDHSLAALILALLSGFVAGCGMDFWSRR